MPETVTHHILRYGNMITYNFMSSSKESSWNEAFIALKPQTG